MPSRSMLASAFGAGSAVALDFADFFLAAAGFFYAADFFAVPRRVRSVPGCALGQPIKVFSSWVVPAVGRSALGCW